MCRRHLYRNQQGAALILVMGILTVLLALGLTFFTLTREEIRVATNVTNIVRSEMLADGAIAMAMWQLNHDFQQHPNYTSTDHAWRTLFNGAWAVGKPWAWRFTDQPLWDQGTALVNMSQMPFIVFEDGYNERLYQGPRTRNWLYIPRMSLNNPDAHIIYAPAGTFDIPNPPANFQWVAYDEANSAQTPFVIPELFGGTPLLTGGLPLLDELGNQRSSAYPKEIVATWADVDSTGDGFRDAMWFPIPGDVFLSDDGLDNDLSGDFDDKENEIGIFAYFGNESGMPYQNLQTLNDIITNGPLPDIADFKVYLTAPLPGIRIPLDITGNGVPDDRIVVDADGNLEPVYIVLPNEVLVQVHPVLADVIAQGLTAHPSGALRDVGGVNYIALTAADVDAIDNDNDMFVNNYFAYAYVGPNLPVWLPAEEWSGVLADNEIARFNGALDASFTDINVDTSMNRSNFSFVSATGFNVNAGQLADVVSDVENRNVSNAELLNRIRITHSGEPVTEIVGRAAIHIRDESSKVNMNVAGAHTQDDFLVYASDDHPLVRALGDGVGPHEYDTRVLPDIGIVRSRSMWNLLTGTPRNASNYTGPYFYDVRFPGYGRVDDTGTALLFALNNIDINGNGLVDEGISLGPTLSPNARAVLNGARDTADFPDAIRAQVIQELNLYREYYYRLGAFEGVDDPFELRRFRPLRNRLAENDGIDNNNSGVIDEIGELGDRQLNSRDQIMRAYNIGDVIHGRMRDLISVHSTDKNVRYFETERGLRALNKINPNFATPQQIAANILIAGERESATRITTEQPALNFDGGTRLHLRRGGDFEGAAAFAEGLRQADVQVRAPEHTNGGGILRVRSGSDVIPTTYGPLHTIPADPLLQAMQAAVDLTDSRDSDHARSVLTTEKMSRIFGINEWPEALNPRERIPENELFPLQELEIFARDTLRINRSYDTTDPWWENQVQGQDDPNSGERKKISHTVSGNEAIKINELMVRPVRRVEAEATVTGFGFRDLNLDQQYPFYSPNLDPRRILGMPYFSLYRTVLPTMYDAFNSDDWIISENTWRREYINQIEIIQFEGVLGDQAGFRLPSSSSHRIAQRQNSDFPELVEIPELFQFTFMDPGVNPVQGEINGMPPGRYYLTLNVNLPSGQPSLPVGGGFYYSIKYVPITNLATNDIVNDALGILSDSNLGEAQLRIDNFFSEYFKEVPLEHYANENRPGEPLGWIFLDGTPEDKIENSVIQADGYFNEFLFNEVEHPAFPSPYTGPYPIIEGITQRFPGDLTHTVSIPPANSGYALCVAVYHEDPEAEVFLNFFDFSQEPAHEYIELANVTDEVVELSGWQLEVGIPDRPGAPSDPFRSLWTIPDDTFIAPQGKLLLAFNKFDSYRQGSNNVVNPFMHRINTNGMGLATTNKIIGDNLGNINLDIRGVTVPPIFDLSYIYTTDILGLIGLPQSYTNLFDPTGSIFERNSIDLETNLHYSWDYVDRFGDGISSYQAINGLMSDSDNVILENSIRSTSSLLFYPVRPNLQAPWDRIVQLHNVELDVDFSAFNFESEPWEVYRAPKYSLYDVTDVDQVARLILRGGVLPNYPEQDGIDNDGDGGYIRFEVDPVSGLRVPVYVPGTLDIDMVDNNLDGRIDTRGEPIPVLDGDGVIIAYTHNPFLSSGVDEGSGVGSVIGRRYGAGSYEAGTLPVAFYNSRADYPDDLAWLNPDTSSLVDFVVDNGQERYIDSGIAQTYDRTSRLGDITYNTVLGNYITEDALYLGTDADPLEWKAFVERRWYPGDNVKVTLYQGAARDNRVADRVTYREYDVINRTPDVGAPSQYFIAGYHANGDPRVTLHPDFPTYWLPNHMGLDFYRSLERKHPLYNGDRFGTTNRWEATNGNYDDWADSISVFEFTTNHTVWPPVRNLNSYASRFIGSGLHQERRLFYHGLWGSPLRRNTAHRMMTNPRSLLAPNGAPDFASAVENLPRQFAFHPDYTDALASTAYPALLDRPVRPDLGWNAEKATVFDRQFHSPGQFARVPQMLFEQRMFRVPGFSPGLTQMNERKQLVGSGGTQVVYTRQNTALRAATLGLEEMNRELDNLLVEVADLTAMDHLVLTVGQAQMTPLAPVPSDSGTLEDGLLWEEGAAGGFVPPGLWSPVFLFALNGDDVWRDANNYPAYPRFLDVVNGTYSNWGVQTPLYYLINDAYLFNASPLFGPINPVSGAFLSDVANPELAVEGNERWPLERRAMMYVSANRGGNQPGNAAEALFEWDADAGLENGEYVLYIGTQYPEMAARMLEAHDAALNQPDVNATDFTLVARNEALLTDFAVQGLLLQQNNTRLGIEVITDPTRARQMGGLGMTPPNNWNSGPAYVPNSDGYIMYGSQGRSEWQPITVRVTDNYLGLRIRNLGRDGEMASLTHVVLAPRTRTQGKININTADARVIRAPQNEVQQLDRFKLYHPFLGIPGIVDPVTSVVPADDIALQTLSSVPRSEFQQTLPPIADFFGVAPNVEYLPALGEPLTTSEDIDLGLDQRHARMQLAGLVMRGKPEHPDGRYYRSPAELVLQERVFQLDSDSNEFFYPLTSADRADQRYEETTERYRRMANLVSTRSDLFEIIVTVQSGYIQSPIGGGLANYRNDDEFITTAETRTRMVYERRTPADRGAQATLE